METPVMIEAKTSIFKQRNKSPFRVMLGESLVCKQTFALLIEENMVLYASFRGKLNSFIYKGKSLLY